MDSKVARGRRKGATHDVKHAMKRRYTKSNARFAEGKSLSGSLHVAHVGGTNVQLILKSLLLITIRAFAKCASARGTFLE